MEYEVVDLDISQKRQGQDHNDVTGSIYHHIKYERNLSKGSDIMVNI